ncbi:hypothetical protein FXO37_35213 [Capsicum annuum]|nr:hypothetical protein FXO37_35213 [Capsicum annuum]
MRAGSDIGMARHRHDFGIGMAQAWAVAWRRRRHDMGKAWCWQGGAWLRSMTRQTKCVVRLPSCGVVEKKTPLSQLVSERCCTKMVTVAQLNDYVTRVRNFIGITDELEQSEGLVDLITQINALKEELALLHAHFDEHSTEFLNTREALMSLVQDQGKVMADLQTEMMVLRRAVAAFG